MVGVRISTVGMNCHGCTLLLPRTAATVHTVSREGVVGEEMRPDLTGDKGDDRMPPLYFSDLVALDFLSWSLVNGVVFVGAEEGGWDQEMGLSHGGNGNSFRRWQRLIFWTSTTAAMAMTFSGEDSRFGAILSLDLVRKMGLPKLDEVFLPMMAARQIRWISLLSGVRGVASSSGRSEGDQISWFVSRANGGNVAGHRSCCYWHVDLRMRSTIRDVIDGDRVAAGGFSMGIDGGRWFARSEMGLPVVS
ncbi:hypothetical protein ACLOJK_022885 [Asimina triloba]